MTIIANAAEDVNNREGQMTGISLPRISFRLAEMTGISLPRISFRLATASQAGGCSAPRMRTRSRYARRGSSHLFQTKRPPQGWPFCLEQMTGIEPAFLAWEANALPLSYICITATIIQQKPELVNPFLEKIGFLLFAKIIGFSLCLQCTVFGTRAMVSYPRKTKARIKE